VSVGTGGLLNALKTIREKHTPHCHTTPWDDVIIVCNPECVISLRIRLRRRPQTPPVLHRHNRDPPQTRRSRPRRTRSAGLTPSHQASHTPSHSPPLNDPAPPPGLPMSTSISTTTCPTSPAHLANRAQSLDSEQRAYQMLAARLNLRRAAYSKPPNHPEKTPPLRQPGPTPGPTPHRLQAARPHHAVHQSRPQPKLQSLRPESPAHETLASSFDGLCSTVGVSLENPIRIQIRVAARYSSAGSIEFSP
jgi:hypothetical protein